MNELSIIFLVMAIGYILGHINFFGIKFGASAILIVALLFGHIGFVAPKILSNLGLVLFLAPIGLMAGPDFIPNIKKNGVSFLLLSFITCVIGGVLIIILSKIFGIPIELSMGIGAGALTSTSMLSTVNSLAPNSNLPTVGYGLAYVFGVVGVVLIVQLIPKFLKADRDIENAKLIIKNENKDENAKKNIKNLITFEKSGLFALAVVIFLGSVLGSIKIPFGNNIKFSLGSGGMSLIIGLIIGNFGNIGRVDFKVSNEKLILVRDFGLALFLIEAGLKAGSGFVEVVSTQGIKLFIVGCILTLVPAIISFIFAYKVFKLPLFAALGTTTGSMTSAPSLGALIQVTEDNKVASFYAATQPTATIMLVFLPQIINLFVPVITK